MGCPFPSVRGNVFMSFYESKWLNKYDLNKPKFYLRYVADILAAFEKERDSLNLLNFLNNKHPNITFMIEKQVNHSIIFLDVFILTSPSFTEKYAFYLVFTKMNT